MKVDIEIPESLNEITLDQYQRYLAVNQMKCLVVKFSKIWKRILLTIQLKKHSASITIGIQIKSILKWRVGLRLTKLAVS